MGTLRLTPLVVHVQRGASVHPRHHLEVGAVEAIHADHAGLGIEVAFVGVGGVQVVLKHRQSVQVLNLRKTTRQAGDSGPHRVREQTRAGQRSRLRRW